jgi:hypothetical protein
MREGESTRVKEAGFRVQVLLGGGKAAGKDATQQNDEAPTRLWLYSDRILFRRLRWPPAAS